MKQKILALAWPLRLFILCAVFLLVVAVAVLWWIDGTSSVDENDTTPQIFVVKKGEEIRSIAARLSSERFIRSRIVFFLLVRALGLDSKIQAGDFYINRGQSAQELAESLTHGAIDVWITIPEGFRVEEIATRLSKELAISEPDFLAVAEEGYMFPDTYLIPKQASAAAIVTLFKNNFDKKITAKMREDMVRNKQTLEDVIVLASLVEREGKNDTDRPMIAGILQNRLADEWPLQVDATLQYALGYQTQDKTWWKKSLFNEDKKISSPYNTYQNIGLPPKPIANPGLAAINAVIYPTPSNYFYYLHDPQGQAHYATTLAEHEANIARYLR